MQLLAACIAGLVPELDWFFQEIDYQIVAILILFVLKLLASVTFIQFLLKDDVDF